jgi:TPR repeat protein
MPFYLIGALLLLFIIGEPAVAEDAGVQNSICNAYITGQLDLEEECLASISSPDLRNYVHGLGLMQPGSPTFDFDGGIRLMEKAAEGGNFRSVDDMIGMFLSTGFFGPTDYAKAKMHLQRSVEHGWYHALLNLAILQKEGLGGFSADINKAITLYQEAADHGIPEAYIEIGRIYHQGIAVPADYRKALEYYTKAKEAGLPSADNYIRQINLSKKTRIKQVVPSAQGQRLALKVYTEESAPRIPGSLDPTGEWLALFARPIGDSPTIVEQLQKRQNLSLPLQLELARRLAMMERPEAITIFTRMGRQATYDAARCTDKTALKAISFFVRVFNKALPGWMAHDEKMMKKYTQAAIENLDQNEDNYWICLYGNDAVLAAQAHEPLKNWQVSQSEWSKIRQELPATYGKFWKQIGR